MADDYTARRPLKPVKDDTLDKFEALAVEGLGYLRQALAYQGENPDYLRKGKLALGVISAYARLRASESGRIAVELAARNTLAGAGGGKLLKGGEGE